MGLNSQTSEAGKTRETREIDEKSWVRNRKVVRSRKSVIEKAPTTKGWSYPVYEELWNYGFPQEMYHFARCARGKETPIATGEDGRIVQEVLLAGYRSAGMGAKIGLPFRPTGIKRPIDLWLGAADEDLS